MSSHVPSGRADRALDRLAHPRVHALGRAWPAFHFCGIIGWVVGIGLAMWLTARLGLSLRVTSGLAVAAFATFLGLTMAVKIVVGEERIVYYHHEIAVVIVSSLLLWSWGQPILPYLDCVFMGLGLFLACGRVGCLMVGCCHGRPHAWGVRYRHEHAEAGFVPQLVGVRLFPIQLVESVWVLGVVALGSGLLLSGARPGTALAWYSILYGVARFSFELVRGDERPYLGAWSEAQWTTLGLMGATTAAELAGVLPLTPAHVAVTAAIAGVMAVGWMRERPARRLLRGAHVPELAGLVAGAGTPVDEGRLRIGESSLGLRLSASTVRAEGVAPVELLAFSSTRGALADDDARRLAVLIARLRQRGEGELVKGQSGVYHLLLPAQEPAHVV
jgi:prolipoprotein diacylglyceryltransferase